MVLMVKKVKVNTLGMAENLDPEDKVDVIKTYLTKARESVPDYDALERELAGYIIELPQEVSLIDLSNMNKLYAIAQAFFTRVSTISNMALGNHALWQMVHEYMTEYLKDRESQLMVTDEIAELRSKELREATIRNRLQELYNKVRKVKLTLAKSELFLKRVDNKKKELLTGMQNLTKQINTLKIERGIQ
jgi:hypothetical protein